ncbi:hypothetical protein CR513_09252, partial [Mucuna pruriens]
MAKHVKMEEEIRLRTKECLRAADSVMCLRRAERDQALLEKRELLEMLVEEKREERERLSRMESMATVEDDIEQKHEELKEEVTFMKA